MRHQNCLVLNSDYSPIGIIPWKKAMIWLFKYTDVVHSGIEIIEYHKDDYVIGSNKIFQIPCVVKTTRYFKIFNQHVNFSRKNVFIRDNFICQYCLKKFPVNQLTYDHVIPKSKWNRNNSPTSWMNIVTSCKTCNLKKGNKTPTQANMKLHTEPFIPKKTFKYLPISYQLNTILKEIPDAWHTYLGGLY